MHIKVLLPSNSITHPPPDSNRGSEASQGYIPLPTTIHPPLLFWLSVCLSGQGLVFYVVQAGKLWACKLQSQLTLHTHPGTDFAICTATQFNSVKYYCHYTTAFPEGEEVKEEGGCNRRRILIIAVWAWTAMVDLITVLQLRHWVDGTVLFLATRTRCRQTDRQTSLSSKCLVRRTKPIEEEDSLGSWREGKLSALLFSAVCTWIRAGVGGWIDGCASVVEIGGGALNSQ